MLSCIADCPRNIHYRRSLLTEGGLEIECQAVINSPATIPHSKLTESYLYLVNGFYAEPTEKRLVEKLLNFVMTLPPVYNA